MLATAFPHGTRILVGVFATLICAGAAAPAVLAQKLSKSELAELLLKRDPGARVGGSTQVATDPGEVLQGVPGRINFMMALGNGQQLLGGQRHDQLGASPFLTRRAGASAARVTRAVGTSFNGRGGHDLVHGGRGHDRIVGGRGHDHLRGKGGHDRIIGGHGHDVIHGGAGHDRLHGGHGHDRFIDRQGNTTVVPGPGRNHIDVSDGGRDRVLCHPRSQNRIIGDRSDRLHRHCRNAHSSVVYRRPPSEAPAARAAQQSVSGAGTNDSPFTAECADPQNEDCTVSGFAYRTLNGLWANEYVPAYQCSSSHPYLLEKSYAPSGTTLPVGVGANGLGDIGMSITGIKWSKGLFPPVYDGYAIGTKTGSPNSSVTNWAIGPRSYQVQLHCTSDAYNGLNDFE
jgi:hypothetical protein